ncbi:MAG: hypothetical protein ABID54_07990 [Pseudomonadota bacterium]
MAKKNRTVTISVPLLVYEEIQRTGKRHERKISAQIRYILKEWTDKEKESNDKKAR